MGKHLPFFKHSLFIFILFILAAWSVEVRGQSLSSDSAGSSLKSSDMLVKRSEWFIEAGRETGQVFNPAYLSSDNLPARFHGFDLKIGKHTSGIQEWQELFRRPIIGVGVTSSYAFKARQYGSHNAFYAFFMAPFLFTPGGRFQTRYLIGYGFSVNSHPSIQPGLTQQDPNHQNIFTSSSFAIYLRFGVEASYRIIKNLDLTASGSLSHFSNGSIQAPNPGVSMVNANAGLRYYFAPLPMRRHRVYQSSSQSPSDLYRADSLERLAKEKAAETDTSRRLNALRKSSKNDQNELASAAPKLKGMRASKKFKPVNELFATGSIAFKQVNSYGKRYAVGSVQAGFTHQYAPKFKWGVAGDLFYNPSISAYHLPPGLKDLYLTPGFFAFHEVLIHHLAFLVGAGLYLSPTEPFKRTYYDRFGYKYYFDHSPVSSVSMTINAHGLSGNFIEFTAGFRLYRFGKRQSPEKVN